MLEFYNAKHSIQKHSLEYNQSDLLTVVNLFSDTKSCMMFIENKENSVKFVSKEWFKDY